MDRIEASKLIGKTVTWKLLEAMGIVEAEVQKPFACAQAGCMATIHKAKGLCVHHYQAMRYEPYRRQARHAASPQCYTCHKNLLLSYWTWREQAYCTQCLTKLPEYPEFDEPMPIKVVPEVTQ